MAHWDVAIVGGGPAGLMAAARAAERGRRTILLDKNRRPGIKILLSGGTRCNLTHATDARGIVAAFGSAGRFLHSALAALSPQDVVDFFEAEGVHTKVEPGGKVFPSSDRAADVLAALVRRVKQSGCTLAFEEPIKELQRGGNGFQLTTTRQVLEAEKVILATGGQSYPACGATGDGYRWAAALGHTIVTPRTALAPVTSHAPWLRELQGITVHDVAVEVIDPGEKSILDVADRNVCPTGQPADRNVCPTDQPADSSVCPPGQLLARSRGSLLFAHFGVTGPVVLDVSRAVSGHPRPNTLRLRCDFLPDLRLEGLDALLLSQSAAAGRRQVAGLLDPWVAHRLAETIVAQAGLPPDRTAAEFSKAERRRLSQTIKGFDIPVAGTMGFRKAEVTAGGVALDEVDSRTVQSRIVPGLYFAGELLDLDGPIGGYNFQAAFSTGWLAGESV